MLKIGVFDSGLGGLTVVKAMIRVIKGADFFYIADTKNAPYGDKTSSEILQYSLDITQYFIKKHAIDVLIVACNTATSVAITSLRQKYPKLIIIGTEPGLKPAITQTKSNVIGVLATSATLKGEKYCQLTQKLFSSSCVKLYEQACVGLVEQIEKGEASSLKTYKMLEEWLIPMKKNSVDTIVLGCTHYPLVTTSIEKIMEKPIFLVNTAEAISQHLLTQCLHLGHKNSGDLKVRIYMTDTINKGMVDYILHKVELIEKIDIKT